jgi:thioredoxin 1
VPQIIELSNENFQDVVLRSPVPVLVDFWAKWCAPCKTVERFVKELVQKYGSGVLFGKLDVDESPEIAGEYSVMSLPTLMLFVKGQVYERIVGVSQKELYAAMIDSALRQVES